ncbi:serine hydrolase domain-containing protein [Pedobacter jejuensis]|uniref:Class A beta-lactamase-related serine hydrolase n=1 Tax=Pedobacter jejuensis TaxID=1268550 RepID=A0A3N0C119_9SPHI|nr:serine hydrolase domain-containing protein [Pedobacter jejuensis]RNL55913.1 class A beta-lactamase-related serine hydrolase [Pedobacter jejuensis]
MNFKKLMTTLLSIGFVLPVFSQSKLASKVDSLVGAYTNIQEFNGSVLVAVKGKILLAKGYGYSDQASKTLNTDSTIFSIASVTKTFTSAMILKLVEEKKLSLDDKIIRFYPGYQYGSRISIANLLNHTSGINDRNIEEKREKYDRTVLTREQLLLAELNGTELSSEPGITFNYSNRGYYLLGNIISKLTNMTYEQAIRKYIFTPYMLKNTGFDFGSLRKNDKAKGYWAETGKNYSKETPIMDSAGTYSAGAIYSNVFDLYKWHEILQNCNFISKESLERAYKPYTKTYGYGWIIDSLQGKRRVSHSGAVWGFRSNFSRIPDEDVAVILLSNYEVPGLDMIAKGIISILYGQPYYLPIKKKAIHLEPIKLVKYVGTYEILESHLVLEVKLESGKLVVYPKNGNSSVPLPESENRFFGETEESLELIFGKKSNKDIITIIMGETKREAIKRN